jgi:tripartite ATP-independent transporter DctP family solute receptor
MKNLSKIAPALCALVLLAGLTGCQKSGKITLKVADPWASTHPMAAAVDNVFKTEIEAASNGNINVDVYHDGTLGSEADLWNKVRNGTVEVVVVGTVMNTEYPVMKISDWPFLYRDLNHAKNVWTGQIAEDMNRQFHEKFPETYMLGWGPNSARTFTSNKKLTSVADFVGQKFRMPSNDIHVGIAENLGASAQVIGLNDLFQALSGGIVDGQDNGMVTVRSSSFDKVQKYLYETNHIIATLEFIINAKVLDGMTPEYQTIVKNAAKQASIAAWDNYIASVDNDRQELVNGGMIVTPLSAEDQAVIIEKIKPLTDKLYADNEWALELTDRIKSVQ